MKYWRHTLVDQSDIILRVEKLVTGYGSRQILKNINLKVNRGEVVAVIGHNGAGKSTLLKALFGILPVWSGIVNYSEFVATVEPRTLLRHGVAYAPQGNRVFHRLTVLENLKLSAVVLDASRRRSGVQRALELFPALKEKQEQQAGTLSGGEKQMLALACVMSLEPHLLLLDEPSLGLSPALIKNAMNRIAEIAVERKVGCLVVEQKVRDVLKIADRTYALRGGKVVYDGAASDLIDDARLREVYL